MTSSRLIRADADSVAAVAWHAPEVPASAGRRLDSGDPGEIQQRAWQQGFEQGRAAGLEAASREIEAHVLALGRVLDSLARPLEDIDNRIETEILALVQAIARQLIRREVSIDATHVVGVIRESLAALPLNAEDVVVRLHPLDAELVASRLPTGSEQRAWRVETDPMLERGGCLIQTSRSTIDGSTDTRLARTIAKLLGDTRESPG